MRLFWESSLRGANRSTLRLLVVAASAFIALPATASPAPVVYWSNIADSSIGKAVTSGGSGETLTLGGKPNTPYGTTVDPKHGRLFWINWGDNRLYKTNLDGSGTPELITSSNINQPTGLTYNPVNDTLYWVNEASRNLRYIKSDGTGAGELYQGNNPSDPRYLPEMKDPLSPVVDPANNKVYWANYNLAEHIGSVGFANLDGSGAAGTILVSHGADSCDRSWAMYSLAVDAGAGKLYTTGQGDSDYYAAASNLDGSDCRSLSAGVFELGVAADSSKLLSPASYGGTEGINTWALPSLTGPTLLDIGSATAEYPAFPTVVDIPSGFASLSSTSTEPPATLSCGVTWSIGTPSMQHYREPESSTAYNWRKDGQVISGETSPTLTASSSGDYSCTGTASNFAGSGFANSSSIRIGSTPPDPEPEPGPSPSPGPTPGPTPGPSPSPKPAPVSNRFVAVTSWSGSFLTTKVRVRSPGRIVQTATLRSGGKGGRTRACGPVTKRVAAAGSFWVRCKLTPAVRAARHQHAVRITVCTTFRPQGGTSNRKCRNAVLASTRPRFTG